MTMTKQQRARLTSAIVEDRDLPTKSRWRSNDDAPSPHREALIRRAQAAINDLYHNATPTYPYLTTDAENERFAGWFNDAATWEVEYIRDGGAYGTNYHDTVSHAVLRKYTSPAARVRYSNMLLREMREDRSQGGRWERITDYGDVNTYGRGARTLAPKDFIETRGGSSFSINDTKVESYNAKDLTEVILIVEAFNEYVTGWCKGVPEMWEERESERIAEEEAETATRERFPRALALHTGQ